MTLDVALAEGLVEVTEISEGGSVPTLKLRNRGERKVLLVDGEELVGARQNRVLNLSVLVAPSGMFIGWLGAHPVDGVCTSRGTGDWCSGLYQALSQLSKIWI